MNAAPFPCVPLTVADHAAMPERFVHEVELPCSAEALFDVLEDPDSWPRWAPGIGHVAWTSPRPFGVGTTRTVTFWGGTQVFETFTEWSRGEVMSFTFTGVTQEIWRSFGERYEVTPLDAGRCRLRWTVSYHPIGGFGRVHRFLRPFMALALRSYMLLLRRYCRGR
jgi:ribosome-associated toxin RatA of RatAB toxin-antitoxin module